MEKCFDLQALYVPRGRCPQCAPLQDAVPLPFLHWQFGHSLPSQVDGVRGIGLMRSDQSVRGSPKNPHPNRGSQHGWGSAFPSLPLVSTCCSQVCVSSPGGDAGHSCIFCGVSTYFPPSFSSDCQENLGLAQPLCLPLTATTPPWISPCLSQPSQLLSLLLTHTQLLMQMNFPEVWW